MGLGEYAGGVGCVEDLWGMCEMVSPTGGFVEVLGPTGGGFMGLSKSKEESVIFT